MAICDLELPAGLVARDFDTPQQLADALAANVAERLKQAIGENGLATLVVSGGRSPVAFFPEPGRAAAGLVESSHQPG